MRGKVRGAALAVVCSVGLAACAEMYPSFDRVDNPDIHPTTLQAGRVVNGVKCAVSAFLVERSQQLIKDALEDFSENNKLYCGVNDKKPNTYWSWKHQSCKKVYGGCKFGEVFVGYDEFKRKINDKSESERVLAVAEWEGDSQSIKKNEGQCVLNPCAVNVRRDFDNAEIVNWGGAISTSNPPSGAFESWDAGSGYCSAPIDRSIFAVDPNNTATIDLTLSASNTGTINFTKINAFELGVLSKAIVAGSSTIPFPMILTSKKDTNSIQMTSVMPQGSPRRKVQPPLMSVLPDKYQPKKSNDAKYNFAATGLPGRSLEGADEFTVDVNGRVQAATNEQDNECRVKGAMDYLALKELIKAIVERQEDAVYNGAPHLAMDTLTITTAFQIIVDASAGTQHIFRFFPLVVPPTVGYKPDHTHTLKLILHGRKAAGLPKAAPALQTKCIERLGTAVSVRQAIDYCSRPESLVLESVAQSVEKSAGNAGAAPKAD